MKKFKTNKGITLIALIITIIVLLILAVVSINLVVNKGILKHAENATDKYKTEQDKEEDKLASAEMQMDKYENGGYTTVDAGKVADNKNKIIDKAHNAKLEDEYGNKIVVPAGFKIKVDADTNNAEHVTEGIVVTDGTNEFVWIPVGNIKKSKEDTTGTPITLGRYVFKPNGPIDKTQSQTAPDAPLKTSASATYYYKEGSIEGIAVDSDGNALKGYAKDINAFISSANNNGGYYLGRYEARTGTERAAKTNPLTTVTENKNDYVYNYVTQLQATEICQGMYTGKPFTSDLINSYSWDTAILFIQTFGKNSNYANKFSVNTSYANKGTDVDKERNIYDMASNCMEWSTETSTSTYSNYNLPCTVRGGGYDSYGNRYTCYRSNSVTTNSGVYDSFRPLLYV